MCLDPLQSLVPDLNAAACRQLCRELEQMEAGREPIQATFEEEQRWARAVARWQERLALLFRSKSLEKARSNAAAKVAGLQLRQRALTLELASRAYQIEKGKPPGGRSRPRLPPGCP
jgi:hypothetical protein